MADTVIGEYQISDVMVCVGKKAGVYLEKFDRLQRKGYSFNWCAALFTCLWFAYRRMWKPAAITMVINVAYSAALPAAAMKLLYAPGNTGWIWLAVPLILFAASMIVFGLLGDRLYWRHISRILDEKGCRGRRAGSNAQPGERLGKAGGTSIIGPAVIWALSLLLQELLFRLAALLL